MKAFIKKRYGGPEVLRFEEAAKPSVKADEVLVEVMANSVNPADWHILRGKLLFARLSYGLFKPKYKIPGTDFAGVVVETGSNVTHLKAGDRVFGHHLNGGAFAEYVSVPANSCAVMPAGTDYTEMACVPLAGSTAYQALVIHGQLRRNETVLINGASGGVGHFAIQIAKACGAKVTAVCSSKNADFVTSLGADKVIAYDKEDIHQHEGQYDLVVDTNGNLSHADYKRMGKRGVMVGFTTMGHMMSVLLRKAFSRFPLAQFTAEADAMDLEMLGSLIHKNKLRVHITQTYSQHDIPEALSYMEKMRTKGKIAIRWLR